MIDIPAARAMLQQRIESKHARIKAATTPEESAEEQCEHSWKRFRETIRADNTRFEGTAHFVVVACLKCQTKKRQALVVEP